MDLKPPTVASVLADIARGLSHDEACQKAARELAAWIDQQALEAFDRDVYGPTWTPPVPAPPE